MSALRQLTRFLKFKITICHFRVEGLACHVGKSEDRERLIEETVKQLGGIDILVSNAGTNPAMGAMLDVSLCYKFGLVIVTFWLDLF
jgi:NAD(P)-dependent dehydrogenase (short-subunit alcohol dehydrogenase family)